MEGFTLIGSFSGLIILGIGGLVKLGRLSTRVEVNEDRIEKAEDDYVTKDLFDAFKNESFRRLDRIENKLDRINGRGQ